MKMRYLVLIAVILGALTLTVIGVGSVQDQGYYPPLPLVQTTDNTQRINISPSTKDGTHYGALVMPTGERSPNDIILQLDNDGPTALKQAQAWAAANHPGAKVMLLPREDTILPGMDAPPMPPR